MTFNSVFKVSSPQQTTFVSLNLSRNGHTQVQTVHYKHSINSTTVPFQ